MAEYAKTANLTEDEMHFLFQCPSHNIERNDLFSLISKSCRNFRGLQDKEKMIWLLNNENNAILSCLCNLIAKCT